MPKRKNTHRLDILIYEYDDIDDCFAKQDLIEKAIGYSDGSGFGPAGRDMDWSFPSRAKADNAAEKVKALKIEGITVEVGECAEV